MIALALLALTAAPAIGAPETTPAAGEPLSVRFRNAGEPASVLAGTTSD